MAILRCSQCGGTLEYDEKRNLAVCTYCGSKSTVFDQDRALYEQFKNLFSAMLNREPSEGKEEGFFLESSLESLVTETGEEIQISYLTKRKCDMCTVYVAKANVIFVFEREHVAYADNYKEMISRVKYPNSDMQKELSRYLPKPVMDCTLDDGRILIAIEKGENVYPLKMLGLLLDRHVAWVMSRLENLCCLLDYNDMVLNGFALENLFVDPYEHQIYLYGGWWFAGYAGSINKGASKQVIPYLEKSKKTLWLSKPKAQGRNRIETDLRSIRMAAASLLGFEDLQELKEAAILPKPFMEFLIGDPAENAGEDFAKWDEALLASYGERKFIPITVTKEEIYSKSGEQKSTEE